MSRLYSNRLWVGMNVGISRNFNCSARGIQSLGHILILTIFLAGGCAGWRYYVESIPYVGETKPETPAADSRRGELKKISLPGIEMYISINNMVRTNDFAVMLVVVPISVDPKDKPYFNETDKLTVGLTIAPTESEFVFDPSRVKIAVDGKEFSSIAARLDFKESRAKFKSGLPALYSPVLLQHPADKQFILVKEEYYSFSMVFDAPVPTPERDIRLDMGDALLHSRLPRIPVIRFMEFRWKQGYT